MYVLQSGMSEGAAMDGVDAANQRNGSGEYDLDRLQDDLRKKAVSTPPCALLSYCTCIKIAPHI